MSTMQLTFAALPEVSGGKAVAIVDSLLKQAILDITERPGDTADRVVTVELRLIPQEQSDGEKFWFQVKSKLKLPPMQTGLTDCSARRQGVAVFNSDSPDNVDQQTFTRDDD